MTTWERIKFEFLRRFRRLKHYNYRKEAQLKHQQYFDSVVKDVITDRKPYVVWGISIPADYLTEDELRHALRCGSYDQENFKRWFDNKVHEIIEDINNE